MSETKSPDPLVAEDADDIVPVSDADEAADEFPEPDSRFTPDDPAAS